MKKIILGSLVIVSSLFGNTVVIKEQKKPTDKELMQMAKQEFKEHETKKIS